MMQTERRRVLGIDYGSRRIGTSLSDPLRIIAQGSETLENNSKLWLRLTEIVRQFDVELIVVGLPLNLKGEKAQKAKEVEAFVQKLKEKIKLPVITWDERFTSTIAHDTLLRMGTRKHERRSDKGRIDSMAAAIMLQSFLDRTKKSVRC